MSSIFVSTLKKVLTIHVPWESNGFRNDTKDVTVGKKEISKTMKQLHSKLHSTQNVAHVKYGDGNLNFFIYLQKEDPNNWKSFPETLGNDQK